MKRKIKMSTREFVENSVGAKAAVELTAIEIRYPSCVRGVLY
jgi:hypothetical protein